ncbi:four helix bundle protein [Gracilimonas mengyeensis]|uniref:Four helix bundle protein n=1 Tax=Gracilimonas mengyeensis TaxID=1302730 RepID=A0A521AD75_9BACT|nr:four helix bundle protein [Gracilimonas mengyeensis]SMO32749.1 four helix bundle protein [Gracilimonas mengyeensis]
MNKTELEDRLIRFAGLIIKIINNLPANKAANHLANQLVRSGTSPALNYGESRSAELLNDFIHKLQIILKELRETYVCLRVIHFAELYHDEQIILQAKSECNELISIFVKSVQTASKKKNRKT